MKARKRDSNDEWKEIAYVQLRDSYCLTSADQMEFQHDTLSTELKTYDQVDEEKHWQNVRERAAIAAMQGLISNRVYADYMARKSKVNKFKFSDAVSEDAIEMADALVKQLKGE